ncbi:MAG TPA: site-specific integrase [Rariglobus sp.]|jgi:integrase|nr:site-specific integrase [Rariglobus sp.]
MRVALAPVSERPASLLLTDIRGVPEKHLLMGLLALRSTGAVMAYRIQKSALFSVHRVRQSNHGRFLVLLRNDTGFPVELVTRYIATELWERESENTTRARLNAINAFYEWGLTLPGVAFDPEKRLYEPDPIDLRSIKAFAQYLRLRRRHGVIAGPGLSAGEDGKRPIVGDHTVAQYLNWVGDFVVWAAKTQARPLMSSARVDELEKWFRDEKRSFKTTRCRVNRGLSVEQQNRLRDICRPDSEENPFNRPVRYRNQAIVHLLLNAPLRRGELLGLRCQDVKLTGGSFYSVTVVVQDENTPSTAIDNRLDRPRQKTNGREIPIVEETKEKLIAYLRNERPARSRSPFLFLGSRDGTPLSLNAVNSIFARLAKNLKTEFPQLYPHLMRHTFNYNFKLHNLDRKLNFDQARQIQNYVNGWSDRSTQADAYGSAANVVIADRYVAEMQAKIVGSKKGA